MMTRKQMEEVLGRGESVIYKGRSIADVKDLPSEEELAAGDEEATAKIADSIEDQIRRLEARRDKLAAGKVATTAGAATPVTSSASVPALSHGEPGEPSSAGKPKAK